MSSIIPLRSSLALPEYQAIYKLFNELYSIPKEKCSLALIKIIEVARLFSSFSDDPSGLSGRIKYIGKTLLEELETLDHSDPIKGLTSVLCEACNFKNALQVEAVFYGSISRTFDIYYRISQLPHLHDMWAEMPFIFENIRQDSKIPGAYCINLAPLKDYFSKLDFDTLPNSFDTTMIQIFQQYQIINGELIVPLGSLPSALLLEAYMESSDFHSKLMAQMLYFCLIEEQLVYGEHSSKLVSSKLLSSLKAQPLDLYLGKRALIPLFGNFVEQLKVADQEPTQLLFNVPFLEKDQRIRGPDWLESSADAFAIVCEIEKLSRRFFKSGSLKAFDSMIEEKGVDKKVIMWTKGFEEFYDLNFLPVPYPIKAAHPFASDREAFKLLPFYSFMKANKAFIYLMQEEAAEAAGARKKHKKSSTPQKQVASPSCLSGGGAGGPVASADTAEEIDEKSVLLSGFGGKFKPKAPLEKKISLEPRALHLKASIEKASDYLKTITFHPRVKVWQKSAEAGLAYYHFASEGAGAVISSEEMVLRHRLPLDLLILALNPHYGIKKPIKLESGEIVHDHFETCLLINEKKYVLEVSINHKGVLFHYYARRVRCIQDYQQMLSITPDQYASVREVIKSPKAFIEEGEEFAPISAGELTFDKDGNVGCIVDKNTYQVPVLKPLRAS
jgi:hypothetical protein